MTILSRSKPVEFRVERATGGLEVIVQPALIFNFLIKWIGILNENHTRSGVEGQTRLFRPSQLV